MATVRNEFQVKLEGPFFERDPSKTVKGNIRDLMDRLAEEGEKAIGSDIGSRAGQMPAYTGWTRERVIGRTVSTVGKRWAATMVISANTDGMDRSTAIRTKAAAATIERRWHPFRRAATAIRRSRALLAADLTKGLD